ncbi:hypothetical protein EL22_12280 [Halostagnicola sp. A56]|uniref:hypothetical protein n=1 Tax=Halostagnicola sp. A56 TaxID=1495067 RepID=UPI00049F15D7|nr:hypothetical protein [Halostagnicola sp. A56]KDE57424.1 hypothetical protein EL22_12280 [Halostagnicola sp. A56]
MSGRSYEGPALDGTVQYITERPELEKEAESVVYATDPEDIGEERTEGIPEIDSDGEVERPDVDGQTSFADWGWSA